MMRMKSSLLLVYFLICSSFVLGTQIVPMPDLSNPDELQIDRDQLYTAEGTTVYIYSLKDFKLVKKFGKEGEGPQEFKMYGTVLVDLIGDYIMVNSIKKVSYFSKKGEFIKEIRAVYGRWFKPLQKNYVGRGSDRKGNILYQTINIYGPELKTKIKEVCRFKIDEQAEGIRVFSSPKVFHTFDNKVFIANKKDYIIDVFDHEGNSLYSIKRDYEKIKFSRDFEEEVHKYFKTHPYHKRRYHEEIKNRLIFPAFFPAIRTFNVADNKIYVQTYRKKGNKREFHVLDMKGKLLKTVFIPIYEIDIRRFYPYTVSNGKLYHLVDSEKSGTWELHITDID